MKVQPQKKSQQQLKLHLQLKFPKLSFQIPSIIDSVMQVGSYDAHATLHKFLTSVSVLVTVSNELLSCSPG